MTPLGLRILKAFKELDKDRLDLHALFDAGGNEPDNRRAVLDTVEELVRQRLLESRGGDLFTVRRSRTR